MFLNYNNHRLTNRRTVFFFFSFNSINYFRMGRVTWTATRRVYRIDLRNCGKRATGAATPGVLVSGRHCVIAELFSGRWVAPEQITTSDWAPPIVARSSRLFTVVKNSNDSTRISKLWFNTLQMSNVVWVLDEVIYVWFLCLRLWRCAKST